MSPKVDAVMLLVLVLAVSIGGWVLPRPYADIARALLAVGLLVDVLSLFYHAMTLWTGQFMSGLPLVGLFFYVWFVLASPRSLVAPDEAAFGPLLRMKLLDALLLVGLHLLFQSPMLLQGPRDRYQ